MVRGRSRWLCGAATALLLAAGSQYAAAAEDTRHEATTSRRCRNEAAGAIPFDRVFPAYRARVRKVVERPSLYRRLPTEAVECHPDLFTFLSTNPDALVAVWRQLGITQVRLDRTGDGVFRFEDGYGTSGVLRIVEQQCKPGAQNRIVLFADASYSGRPFRKPLTAEGVFLFRSGSITETDSKTYVAARLDSFIRLNNASVQLLAKAAHPLLGKMADKNFVDSVHFIGQMSQAAQVRYANLNSLAAELPGVSVGQRRELQRLLLASRDAELARSRLGQSATATRR
ncbi:MAG: hypothetical protein AAGA92_05540 [Planctomycetota bacterium]